MNLQILKEHIRVDHDFEDELLIMYYEWAAEEIKDSVSTEKDRDDSLIENSAHFERAVILLTGHYFENRLPMSEVKFTNLPFGIASALHKLRGAYLEEKQD